MLVVRPLAPPSQAAPHRQGQLGVRCEGFERRETLQRLEFVRTSLFASSLAASSPPTTNVLLVSPYHPSSTVVTSTLTMSPAFNVTLSDGTPWQTTSLTLMQDELG